MSLASSLGSSGGAAPDLQDLRGAAVRQSPAMGLGAGAGDDFRNLPMMTPGHALLGGTGERGLIVV